MALTTIEQVRLLIADNEAGLYLISDEELEFLLERNNNSVNRTSLEAAKVILLNLSMRGDSTVDIFSLKNSKSAEQYRLALQMFIKDPNLNPVYQNLKGYFGGVSISDMEKNDAISDNNTVPTVNQSSYPTDYFSV